MNKNYFSRKRRVRTTMLLLSIYLVVMAVIGYPHQRYAPDGADRLINYLIILGISVLCLVFLGFVLDKKARYSNRYDTMEPPREGDDESDDSPNSDDTKTKK